MFPRERRLRAGRDWDALFQGGFSVAGSLLSLRVKPTAGTRRVGFSVGKKVGGAVTRNLVKRRLRAITADSWDSLPEADIGILVRAAARNAAFDDLRNSVAELAERAEKRIAGGRR